MFNTLPSHIGDMQQTVNIVSEINECTVFSKILNGTFNNFTFFNRSKEFFSFGRVFVFKNSFT